MDESIGSKVRTLMESVFKMGVDRGREIARTEIVALLSQEPVRTRKPRTARAEIPGPTEQPEPPPPAPVQPPAPIALDQPLSLSTVVNNALHEMPADGIDPDGLTTYINAQNGHEPVTVRDVRGVLRQLMMSGDARRVARGRYIAASAGVPQPGGFI